MTEVIWHRSLPTDIAREVRPLVNEFMFLVPGWLHCLTVRYQDNATGGYVAEIDTMPEYRQASLTIVPLWREQTKDFRRLTIAHELTHIALAPLENYARSLIEKTVPDEGLRAKMLEDLRSVHEGATEDISRAVYRSRPKKR